jgi:hypothetical protein
MLPWPVGYPGFNNSGKGLIQLIEVQNGLILLFTYAAERIPLPHCFTAVINTY